MTSAFNMAMLVCADLSKSRDFYRNVMGLRMGTDASPHWVDFDLGGGVKLGLHPAGHHLLVRPGSLQLAFWVEDVDRFINDLRVAGITILQEPFEQSFGRMAVIADPDGYPVQVGTKKS
jgi:catechol 2,3-dioxygenase-like lactoylglutathione lyase family enzyme